MKIETKLNIGDICYFMTINKIFSSVIESISIRALRGELNIEYQIRNNQAGTQYTKLFSENEIFATKQDLLNSLQNKIKTKI